MDYKDELLTLLNNMMDANQSQHYEGQVQPEIGTLKRVESSSSWIVTVAGQEYTAINLTQATEPVSGNPVAIFAAPNGQRYVVGYTIGTPLVPEFIIDTGTITGVTTYDATVSTTSHGIVRAKNHSAFSYWYLEAKTNKTTGVVISVDGANWYLISVDSDNLAYSPTFATGKVQSQTDDHKTIVVKLDSPYSDFTSSGTVSAANFTTKNNSIAVNMNCIVCNINSTWRVIGFEQ